MVSGVLSEVVVGVYLGLLSAFFPALIAFGMGVTFKYFTGVTVPGLGVVVLGGALAGVSGGLMGLMSPEIGDGWTGITAFMVILMACLWAHGQGDKIGASMPRGLTIKSLKESRLSADVAERVDSFGQFRVRPIGEVQDIEGHPPLPDDLRAKIRAGSWKFPADLPIEEIETQLEEKLVAEFEIAEAAVELDRKGRASIAAAPTAAGLSRRVPKGLRAVTISTLVPTGLYRGDEVTVRLPSGDVTGEVVSARSGSAVASEPAAPAPATGPPATDGGEEEPEPTAPTGPTTTTGGEGQVTVALPLADARRVVEADFAPVVVRPRGKQREYETIGILESYGNRFRKLTVGATATVAGRSIGEVRVRDEYGVAILSIRRGREVFTVPRGTGQLLAGDELIVVGKREDLDRFEAVVA